MNGKDIPSVRMRGTTNEGKVEEDFDDFLESDAIIDFYEKHFDEKPRDRDEVFEKFNQDEDFHDFIDETFKNIAYGRKM